MSDQFPEEDLPPSPRRIRGTIEWLIFRRVVTYGGSLALMAALAMLQDLWIAQLVLIPMLFTVPGLLLLNAMRVPGTSVANFPLYVPACSLVVLMTSGLAVNIIGAQAGMAHPLRPAPLLIGLEVICLVLLLFGTTAPLSTAIPRPAIPSAAWLALMGLLPLMAAVGALRLNHGQGSAVAIGVLVTCGVVLILAAVLAGRLDVTLISLLLFAISLAMMWAYSLRSDLMYGFDISTEYAIATQTIQDGVWQMHPHKDAYGAMLSITVLPAQLHALTGVDVALVLKLAYPAAFAMFVVGIFNIATRFLPRRWALLAAAYVLVQGGVSQQLPALTRQEVALLLFLALCAAMLEIEMPRPQRVALVIMFGPALVVSHYSSAYFAIMMLVGAIVMQVLLAILRRATPVRWTVVAATVAATISAVAWYGPVTQSASNLGQLRTALSSDGLQLLPHGQGKGIIGAYLAGGDGATISAAEYDKKVREEYAAQRKYVVPSEGADDPRYALKDAPLTKPTPRLIPIGQLLELAVLIFAQLGNLLALVAAAVMAFTRRSPGLTRQVGLLALPALGALVLFRLSGTLASTYNQGRAQIQALTLVSVALFWMLHKSSPHLRKVGLRFSKGVLDGLMWTAVAGAVLAIFLKTSGLSAVGLNGSPGTNLKGGGEDTERYYMYRPEIASAAWLAANVANNKDFVYSDRYGQTRLFTQMGAWRPGMLTDLAPPVINNSAWIYATRVNVVQGRARSSVTDGMATYAFPADFIKEHYDLVYSNGTSEVFHK
ncbi:hypothetical protein J4573_06570 [Actinomadura barringtoniae]|uniref:DUF2206 domain-containing protein n=1 Tax=Actinomadura barringtoniae TaxID=1427535 RepID=A0A939P7R8_9ACTN|nr:hypothetical protein [Actinomadura barringtoniae]MBO2446747.1 hypothetical protein [Actinomadura barringtoniae]